MDAESLMNSAMFGKLIAILALVVGLILLFTWFARRSGLGNSWQRNGSKTKRLSVLEVRPIDNQRRLILVERDTSQHLLLIGGQNDLVIESNIGNSSGNNQAMTGADALNGTSTTDSSVAEDPLERVRFRDVLPQSAKETDTRILRPTERIAPTEDEA